MNRVFYSIIIGVGLGLYTIILITFYNLYDTTVWTTIIFLFFIVMGVNISNKLSRHRYGQDKYISNKITLATYILIGVLYFML